MNSRTCVDEQLAVLLASGLPIVEAARKAFVSERTARRRLENPTFRAHVDSLRSRMVSDALAKLEGAMSGAADTLRDLLDHTDPHVRLRSCDLILRNALRVKEVNDLGERLARIERQLEKP